jgi:hypothetical protein
VAHRRRLPRDVAQPSRRRNARQKLAASTIDVTFGGAAVAHLDLPGVGLPAAFARHEWTATAPAHTADLWLHGDASGAGGFPIVDGVRLLPLAG